MKFSSHYKATLFWCGFVLVAVLGAMQWMYLEIKNGPIFESACAYVNGSADFGRDLGSPIKISLSRSFRVVWMSGSGRAKIRLNLSGPTRKRSLKVWLEERTGRWVVTQVE